MTGDTSSQVHPDLADAAELAEMLTFISQWPGGTGHTQLAASFARFTGTHGYDLADLRTDLARFTFLLGHDDGEQLSGTGHSRPSTPCTPARASLCTAESTPAAVAATGTERVTIRQSPGGMTHTMPLADEGSNDR